MLTSPLLCRVWSSFLARLQASEASENFSTALPSSSEHGWRLCRLASSTCMHHLPGEECSMESFAVGRQQLAWAVVQLLLPSRLPAVRDQLQDRSQGSSNHSHLQEELSLGAEQIAQRLWHRRLLVPPELVQGWADGSHCVRHVLSQLVCTHQQASLMPLRWLGGYSSGPMTFVPSSGGPVPVAVQGAQLSLVCCQLLPGLRVASEGTAGGGHLGRA